MIDLIKTFRSPLCLVIVIACIFRVSVFIYAIIFPIPNEGGYLVSPLLPQNYSDFAFYLESLNRYSNSWGIIFSDFIIWYSNQISDFFLGTSLKGWGGPVIAQPIFPALIYFFNFFSSDSYFPLSLFYLFISCIIVSFWIWWLHKHGVSVGWLIIFSILPNPVWFTLVISPDLLFSGFFAGFYFFYFHVRSEKKESVFWFLFLLLMLLTRPESYAVLIFVSLNIILLSIKNRSIKLKEVIPIILLLLTFGLFLLPYFMGEVRKAGDALMYFGYTPSEYLSGLFDILPFWIDKPSSWIALIGSKILYFVGIRPSFGSTEIELVLARSLAGLILLPGIFQFAVYAPIKEKIFFGLYLFPILLGPSQDRYYLAIYPIFFLYGTHAYNLSWNFIKNRILTYKN